jgi:hypothetical protein
VQAAESTKCRRGKLGELLELSFVLLGNVGVVVFVRELEQAIVLMRRNAGGTRNKEVVPLRDSP